MIWTRVYEQGALLSCISLNESSMNTFRLIKALQVLQEKRYAVF